MPSAVLQTKLNVPQPPAHQLARPRLVAALEDGLQGTVTVVAAPAGYGKTTVIAQWLAALTRPAAWLSLDADDNDPRRFFTYLAAAVGSVGGDSPQLRRSLAEEALPRALATAFLRDVAKTETAFVLVLDDYHLLEVEAIHQALAFLVAQAPPSLNLVLSGRQRPPLALTRLQLSGQLMLLDAVDLRLTPAEAHAFFKEVMALDVTLAVMNGFRGQIQAIFVENMPMVTVLRARSGRAS